jgi:cell filamentation protein
LLLIHPFREGNGRLGRWIAELMLMQAGFTMPDYGLVGRGSKQVKASYLDAVVKGYYQDYSGLARFFEEALARGYASARAFDNARGEAPSKMDD